MRTSTGMKADPIPVNLPDVTQTGQRDFEDIVNVFAKHHVSRGEVKVIFKTADINEDNMISIQEWGDFHGLFIEPFEEADSGGEYLLDQGAVEFALASTWFEAIQEQVSAEKENIPLMIEAFDRWSQESKLNFADYLFWRKSHLAWKICASEDTLSSRKMNCALHITAPGRIQQIIDGKDCFRLANIIKGGTQNSQSAIDYVQFLQVAHLHYYFTEFSIPFSDKGTVNKKDLLRAIEEGVLPTTLSSGEVSSIYGRGAEWEFKAFGAALYSFRLHRRFGVESPGTINIDEFQSMFDIPNFNQGLLGLVDGTVTPTQDQVDSASLFRLGKANSEYDFFAHFLQVKESSKRHRHIARRFRFHKKFAHRQDHPVVQEAAEFDDNPRMLFFRQYDGGLAGKMVFDDFNDFWKFSWMFQNYDSDGNGFVDDKEMMQGQQDQVQVLPMDKYEYRDHEELKDWMGQSKDFSCNLKEFGVYFNYRKVFHNLRSNGYQVHAIQWRVHKGFIHLGIRLSKSTENLSIDGANQLLDEREYHFKQMVYHAVEDEVIALKLINGRR